MAMKIVGVLVNFVIFSFAHYDYGYNPHLKGSTPVVQLKQGQLMGIIVDTPTGESCEQYLGIPYAAAPINGLRFMPPGSAPPWPHLRRADTPGAVCPQKLPEMKHMVEDRKEAFKRLVQHFTNQSEDCLFLNIYTPDQGVHRGLRKYPVIIYIHGQSYGGNYEWNSGNPYDGCVLSSYGKVVFITINYRLGILGFLKTGVGNEAHSNLGLKDQVAALWWVQENIASFGGDPRSVTLMGHGTGAACVNFLMMSPMVVRDAGNELFHRAILMSGSALSDWALATNSLQLTLQVAQTLNCPSGDDELATCLRQKRLKDIMDVPVEAPRFVTKFGPVVDGLAVPNIPKKLMSRYNDLFSRYEMMFGLTEIESDHLLNGVQLIHGLFESERNDILRKYLQARFEYHPDKALDSTLREYANLSLTSTKHYRDTVLEVLSDARVAAPVVQTGNYHSAINPKSYFYVFGHSSHSKDYLREKSLHGEELQYVFGAPLGGARHLFSSYYTEEEKLFSEIIMTLWTNFAHTGNPMAPRRTSFRNMRPSDWEKNWPRDWPEYDTHKQQYMLLAIPPEVQNNYKEPFMEYWNDVLPKKLKNSPGRSPINYNPLPITKPNSYFPPTVPSRFFPPFFTTSTEPPFIRSSYHFKTTSPTFGVVKQFSEYSNPEKQNFQSTKLIDLPKSVEPEPTPETVSATMNIIIIIGSLFLLVNLLTFAGLYYKRKRLKNEERNLKRQYEDTNLLPVPEVSPEKKPKIDETSPETLQRGCNVMKMIRQSTKSEDTYEAVVKQSEEGSESHSRFKLARHISTSTIDPHTKVRDWIAHEIVQRCSPRFLRRTRQQFALEHKLNQQNNEEKKKPLKTSETKTLVSTTTTGKNTTSPVNPLCKQSSTTSTPKTGSKNVSSGKSGIPTKPKKVSVAVDATPGARGSSVLKQQPIELSKSMDLSTREPAIKPLRRSVTMDDFLVTSKNETVLRRSITNVNLKLQGTNAVRDLNPQLQVPNADIIKIRHQYSRSDPVKMMPGSLDEIVPHETVKLKTFDANQDVNVTSRDDIIRKGPPLTPEEALQTIKRRNFPKVLPDFPDQQSQINALKRRSLPSHHLLLLPSLPEKKSLTNTSSTLKYFSRIPPAPPPRTSSTLGRKPSITSIPICHPSPVKFAEEPPLPAEPVITSNTLHVGPIIPSRQPHKITNPGTQSYQLNTQPIYDNLRTPEDKKTAGEMKKHAPKTIITTDPDQPVKKVEQPKVIIKPSISKKVNDPTKVNKVIPRVVAKDLSIESDTNKEERKKEDSKTNVKIKLGKISHIPTFCKSSSQSHSSSDSSSSTFDGSDTGTVVKRE